MSYKLTPDRLSELIPRIEQVAKENDDALCRIFVLIGDPDLYALFNSLQHKECLEYLQREVGRGLSSNEVAFAGSLEYEDEKYLMLMSGGYSFGKFYKYDLDVGQLVRTTISEMLKQIGSQYILR